MNLRIVRYITGWVIIFEGAFLVCPLITGVIYKEYNICRIYILVIAVCLVFGMLLKGIRRKDIGELYIREGFACVSLSWIALSLFGALPFYISGEIPKLVDAVFEVASGLTTTGASILSDVESLSRAGMFWRCFTHWIGGMGVFVFIMAILPMAGARNINLMKAESPGPSVSKFMPRMKDTAKLLYIIYIVITMICVLSYLLSGMSLYEALTLGFGTVGTGGFGIYNDSMASFTPLQQNLMTFFMIISGINYSVYFCIVMGNFREILSFEEVRYYLLIIAGSVSIIAWNIFPIYKSAEVSLRHSAFQVASIITTSGFSTADFDLWPELSKGILVLLMITGACAGSTGGGLKVSRALILMKGVGKEIQSIIHPQRVRRIYLDGEPINDELLRTTNAYAAIYAVILIVSALIITRDGFDLTSNLTAVLATLNNIGPGLNAVGPTQNFGTFSSFSKCVLIFDMLAGRLELFPILILLLPSCWRKY
ncbi:MAG: TrkH family potassium uptake protein [Lachnospiraceae bacterium]|nr:TrkH family potassium uptake protein [Lachnospiraceae bacterium]